MCSLCPSRSKFKITETEDVWLAPFLYRSKAICKRLGHLGFYLVEVKPDCNHQTNGKGMLQEICISLRGCDSTDVIPHLSEILRKLFAPHQSQDSRQPLPGNNMIPFRTSVLCPAQPELVFGDQRCTRWEKKPEISQKGKSQARKKETDECIDWSRFNMSMHCTWSKLQIFWKKNKTEESSHWLSEGDISSFLWCCLTKERLEH